MNISTRTRKMNIPCTARNDKREKHIDNDRSPYDEVTQASPVEGKKTKLQGKTYVGIIRKECMKA